MLHGSNTTDVSTIDKIFELLSAHQPNLSTEHKKLVEETPVSEEMKNVIQSLF